MYTVQLDRGSRVSDRDAITFLHSSLSVIRTFSRWDEIFKSRPEEYLPQDKIQDAADVGIDLDLYELMYLEELAAQLEFDSITLSRQEMLYGKSDTAVMFYRASGLMSLTANKIQNHIVNMQPFTQKERKDICYEIRYGFGNFIFALGEICHLKEIINAIVSADEIILDSVYSIFLSEEEITINQFAGLLLELRRTHPATLPLFETNPEEWFKLLESIDSDVAEAMLEYSSFVSPLDLKAYKAGHLQFDGDYIEHLETRALSETSIVVLYPDQWSDFISKVPQSLAYEVYKREFDLNIVAIEPVLKGGVVNKKFLAELDATTYEFGGLTGHQDVTTQLFEGK